MSTWFYDVEPLFGMYDTEHHDAFNRPGAAEDRRAGGIVSKSLRGWQPKMDIHENPESNLMTATIELPGLKKEDVSIDLRQNRLVISGERNYTTEVSEHGYVHKERQTGKFSRVIPVPLGIKPEEVKASMEHGVLAITYPKFSTEQKPNKITIN